MLRLFTTLAVATFSLGLNAAIAKEADSTTAKQWSDFQVSVKKCDTLTGTEKTNCLAAARKTYRSSHFDCDTMAPRDKAECQKYHDKWMSAAGSNTPQGTTPAVRTGEPNTMPANPSDPSDKERNRDSTKQQAGSTQPSKKP
jgi:hypothetical protein